MQPQADLFGQAPSLPEGLAYAPAFVSRAEETALLERLAELPVAQARYREFTAKRRTLHFGFGYDFAANRLQSAPAFPDFLVPLRTKAAAWAGLPPERFEQALVTEYRPGTPIGWHRDVPQFDAVFGLSLQGACRMLFRPYPPTRESMRRRFALRLEPRSAYLLRDAIRWDWQHAIPDVESHRWSITLRTMRAPARHLP